MVVTEVSPACFLNYPESLARPVYRAAVTIPATRWRRCPPPIGPTRRRESACRAPGSAPRAAREKP